MTISIINESEIYGTKDPFLDGGISQKLSRAYRDGSDDQIMIGL
jgi:hypothetical protein